MGGTDQGVPILVTACGFGPQIRDLTGEFTLSEGVIRKRIASESKGILSGVPLLKQ